MSNSRITPFVKRMRTNGGTIYTFSSAVEDIGLNINERNNIVKISHFALLNIPSIAEASTGTFVNTFNVRNIAGAWEYEQGAGVKDGRVLIAESFQNYALNLESNLLNQSTYNPELTNSISERVFWKWLKETGAVRWDDPSIAGNGVRYWTEEIQSNNYNSVIKYVGQVSAGNVRIDSFGTYNETYVLVPTSHGQTRAYFKQVEDDNYHHSMEIGDLDENILGRTGYTKPHPDGLSYLAYYDFVDSSTQVGPWFMQYDDSSSNTFSGTLGWWYSAEGIEPNSVNNAYLTDSSSYLTSGIYNTKLQFSDGGNTIEFKRSKVDCVSLEFDLNNLKTIFGDSTLTYDKMAIDYQVNDTFNFNAVLIYYSVYNSTLDQVLATNLLGIMFLDAPSGNSSQIGDGLQGIQLPSLEKIASSGNGYGTSYSLRLNIKTDNMFDDTAATIVDFATSDQLWVEEWQQAFQNLEVAVNTLTQQNATINFISGQYVVLQENQTQILNRLINLEFVVNDIGRDIQGVAGTVPLFSDGDDPLIESSIYMKFGKVGIFNNDPKYALHVDGSVKVYDITIENAVRDTSGNILLGYGSPLQIGSSTNFRDVNVYTGNILPAVNIDSSNNVKITDDVSILGNLQVDSSTVFKGSVYMESSIFNIAYPNFDFAKKYLDVEHEIGAGLIWSGGFLSSIPSSDVSAAGNLGDIQFASSGGALYADPSSLFVWDVSNKRLGVNAKDPSVTLHVIGETRLIGTELLWDGSLFNVVGEINGVDIKAYGYLAVNSSYTSARLSVVGNTLLDGDISIGSGANRTLRLNPGTTGRTFTIGSNNISGSSGTGGALTLVAGNGGSSTGAGGNISISAGMGVSSAGGGVTIRAGQSVGSVGGDVSIYANSGASNGGSIYLKSGSGAGIGGHIFLDAGTGTGNNGRIFIGSTTDTSAIILGNAATIPTGTPGALQVLYVDTADSYRVKRGTVTGGGGSGSVDWANGNVGSNNYVITANGDGSIVAESALTFNGTSLTFTGSADRNISHSGGASYDLNISGGGNLILRAGTTVGDVYVGGDNSSAYSANLYFYAGNATYERLHINSSGQLLINDDATNISTPASKVTILRGSNVKGGNTVDPSSAVLANFALDIRSSATTNGSAQGLKFTIGNSSTLTGTAAIYAERTGSNGAGRLHFAAQDVGAASKTNMPVWMTIDGPNKRIAMWDPSVGEKIRFANTTGNIDADGDVTAFSSTVSDIRFKENIKKLENPLAKILQVEGVSYNRKRSGEFHLGVIAQDIEKIIPEVVVDRPMPLETGDEETLYKTVRYQELIPYLIEAIKEQQIMIDELKSEIRELKNIE